MMQDNMIVGEVYHSTLECMNHFCFDTVLSELFILQRILFPLNLLSSIFLILTLNQITLCVTTKIVIYCAEAKNHQSLQLY